MMVANGGNMDKRLPKETPAPEPTIAALLHLHALYENRYIRVCIAKFMWIICNICNIKFTQQIEH